MKVGTWTKKPGPHGQGRGKSGKSGGALSQGAWFWRGIILSYRFDDLPAARRAAGAARAPGRGAARPTDNILYTVPA